MTGLIQAGFHSAALMAAMFPLHPPASSTIAEGVDQLYFALTAITLFFTVLIFGIIFYFMLKYRRRSEDEKAVQIHEHLPLELAWTIIPTLICVIIFFWSANLYVRNSRPPKSAMEIFVIGKQWMWHIQHPEGIREINELHVPVGVPVKVTMTSQDVIHDFYIPAFRVKKDVLPGRYSSIWFEANQTGTYHLYCAQYCGTNHSAMIGWVYVMSPNDYETWLVAHTDSESMAQQGARLFTQFSCSTCHAADGKGLGPSFVGLYGKSQKLKSGEIQIVDDAALRRSIVDPNSMLLPDRAPVMPSFQGQLTEDQVLQLIAYIKSLGSEERTGK